MKKYLFKHSDKIRDCEYDEAIWHVLPWTAKNFNETVGREWYPALTYLIANRLQQIYVSDEAYTTESKDLKDWVKQHNRFIQDIKCGKLRPYKFSEKSIPQELEDFWEDFLDTVSFVIENLSEWRKEVNEQFEKAIRQRKNYFFSHWIKTPCDAHKREIMSCFNKHRDERRRKIPKGYLTTIKDKS